MKFKQAILQSFNKFKDPATVQKAQEEIEDLINDTSTKLTANSTSLTDTEKMSIILYHISEEFSGNESGSMKPSLRRELIKLMARLAEIYEESFLT